MIKVERTSYGFKMTVEGFLQAEDFRKANKEIRNAVAGRTDGFGGLVDFRNAQVLARESQEAVKEIMETAKGNGLKRSAIILSTPIATLQSKRLAQETGIYATERYIDASKEPNWEKVAVAWIEKGVDPDKK